MRRPHLGGGTDAYSAFLLAILIGGVLFDLDAWGMVLAIIIAGVIGGLISMAG